MLLVIWHIQQEYLYLFIIVGILFIAGIFTKFQNVAHLRDVDIAGLSIPSKDKNKQTDKNHQKPQTTKKPLFVPGWCTVPIKYDLHYNNLLYED